MTDKHPKRPSVLFIRVSPFHVIAAHDRHGAAALAFDPGGEAADVPGASGIEPLTDIRADIVADLGRGDVEVNGVRVALDERGTALSSADLARKLEAWRDGGRREARLSQSS